MSTGEDNKATTSPIQKPIVDGHCSPTKDPGTFNIKEFFPIYLFIFFTIISDNSTYYHLFLTHSFNVCIKQNLYPSLDVKTSIEDPSSIFV